MANIYLRRTRQKHTREALRSTYSLVSTHTIDVDKASIMPQNCCVPDCTKKVDVEGGGNIFVHSLTQLFDILH